MEQNKEISCTKNLDQFSMLALNRAVDRNHVENLKIKISNQNDLHLFPIIVNKSFEVVDGQHRLAAAKDLDIGIYYVIDENFHIDKIAQINTSQKRWTIPDYVNHWAERGRDDYKRVLELSGKTDWSISCSIVWLASSEAQSVTKSVKNGSLEALQSQSLDCAIESAHRFIEYIKKEWDEPQRIFNDRRFHRAVKQFFKSDLVDDERFFERLKKYPHQISLKPSTYEFVCELIKIYNYFKQHNLLCAAQKKTVTKIFPQ